VVNCLNFGNPEHPEVMWQLSESVDGLAEACRAAGLPVVGGNVSLYNESAGADIDPTPVLGVLGLVEELRCPPPGLGWREGSAVVLLGARRAPDGPPHPLGASRWARECRGRRNGRLAAIDWDGHLRLCALVRDLVVETVSGAGGLLDGVHDVADGGLAVCLAEMAVAAGTGVRVGGAEGAELDGHAELFSERASRVVAATAHPDELLARAASAGVPAVVLGRAGGDRLWLSGLVDLPLHALSVAWADALPSRLDGPWAAEGLRGREPT
jgi:phosphoribosylformylglycinamidine synthase